MKKRAALIVFTFLLHFLSLGAKAADYYLTPLGAGDRSGSSWENAFAQESLEEAFNTAMKPGDRLLLSGIFSNISWLISNGGLDDQPKSLVGVDRGGGFPIFQGKWSIKDPAKGQTAIRIDPGVSHVRLANLSIRNYRTGIQTRGGKGLTPCSHLQFENVDIEQFRYGFYLADCDDLRLADCDLKRYSKHAFRFEMGCDRVQVIRCSADCSEGDAEWEKKTELLPFGFSVNNGGAPNTAFTFEECLAQNNLMPLQKEKYKNGDGFVVEGNTVGVEFTRCRALRNQDGGFDLKAADARLTDCVAVGNSRAYRIWTSGHLTNCFAGWGGIGLWCNGGPVTANRITFHHLRDAVLTDDKATQPVTLSDCILSDCNNPHRKTARGETILIGTITAKTENPTNAPKFWQPHPEWDGTGNAMNSRAFPDKGYQHAPKK